MKDSGPQKNLRTPTSSEIGHSLHRPLEVGSHAVPVRRQLAEGEVRRDAADVPRRADRFEETDHQAAPLFAVVAVRRRIFEDRPVRIDAGNGVGDEVVVLGGLQRDRHAVHLAQLSCPHARAVDDVLALDLALRGGHRR